MSTSAALSTPQTDARAGTRRWTAYRPSPVLWCFLGSLLIYLALAALVSALSLQRTLGGGDGVSRVEIANRILFSRDPHLAAIGFLWGPVPELALLPLVALKPLWPALVTQALAGSIMSAVFMAGASAAFLGLCQDLRLPRGLTWALTAAFALDPVILVYASNGMSEAALLFFLLLVTRSLHRWLRTQSPGALVATGLYLALAYLTRYEACAAAVAVAVVVMVASFQRSRGPLSHRRGQALLDGFVVGLPFALAFLGWALICWVVTGVPFADISGVYGNGAQNVALGITTPHSVSQVLVNVEQALPSVLGMEPFLPIVAIAVLVLAVRRRDWCSLGAVAPLGAVFGFMAYAYVTRDVSPQLRYLIVDIPFALVMAGVALAPAPRRTASEAPDSAQSQVERAPAQAVPQARARSALSGRLRLLSGVVAAAMTVALGLRTVVSVQDPTSDVAPVFHALVSGTALPATTDPFAVDRKVSAYLDALRLPEGAVLMDDFLGFPIEIYSADPQQFVISSDTDFQQCLADPAANGVEYVLIPSNTHLGVLDAINRSYPKAYATGQGIGTLVRTFKDLSGFGTNWRLYRVTSGG
jgi:hypothetical protein